MLTIINYNAGNIGSISNMAQRLGADTVVSSVGGRYGANLFVAYVSSCNL